MHGTQQMCAVGVTSECFRQHCSLLFRWRRALAGGPRLASPDKLREGGETVGKKEGKGGPGGRGDRMGEGGVVGQGSHL